jgi:hypothetical protein
MSLFSRLENPEFGIPIVLQAISRRLAGGEAHIPVGA